jgi:hypothetical protein
MTDPGTVSHLLSIRELTTKIVKGHQAIFRREMPKKQKGFNT